MHVFLDVVEDLVEDFVEVLQAENLYFCVGVIQEFADCVS